MRTILLGMLLSVTLSAFVNSKSITLSWIASGDDGMVGTAYEYDIRYATFQITDNNWNLATRVLNAPVPKIAGSKQSIIIENLDSTKEYYFAIKAADEVNNWSRKSSAIAKVFYPDRCIGEVGNVDCDNEEIVDIGDLTILISCLFIAMDILPCPLEGNIDGNAEPTINIGDLTALIDYLFISGDALPSCQQS